jgi:hypothetical protein
MASVWIAARLHHISARINCFDGVLKHRDTMIFDSCSHFFSYSFANISGRTDPHLLPKKNLPSSFQI